MDYLLKTKQLQKAVADRRPLVHHITNFVTMYQCARITSVLGASPIMAFAAAESAEVAAKADSLVINTGTLNNEVIASIPKALEAAARHQIPVILDPVGLQLSAYRHDFILFLLESFHFDVLRCNSAELLNLHSKVCLGKGIDCAKNTPVGAASEAAVAVSEQYKCTVACTGETDIIAENGHCFTLHRGSRMLPKLVGTGCMVNSLIGAFLPVSQSASEAAAAGILTMCLAGEKAETALKQSEDIGTFEVKLLDYLRI